MGVANGQAVNATVTNGALASKFFNNTYVGIQTLNHPTSGPIINNVQQALNDVITESAQNAIAVADHENRLDILEPIVTANTLEITSLRTLSGTLSGENDFGTFTGSTLPDNEVAKVLFQALETEVELKENAANKGVANGYAPLDGSGLVPAMYLPSYVDDVLEYADLASFPVSGETGKIYVALDTGFIYRWSGTMYVQLNVGGVVSVNGLVNNVVIYKTENDNTSGSDVTLAAISVGMEELTSHIRLTNAGLVSVEMIPAGFAGQQIIYTNKTTVPVIFKNDVGATPANRILTGTSADLTVEVDASIWLVYDATSQRWNIVGGSGSGGAAITVPGTTTPNAIVLWDAADGSAIKNSDIVVTGNKIEGTQTNTDFDLDANGTGNVRALAPLKLNEALLLAPQTDSSATGDNATLAAPLNTVLIVDNINLNSIEGITAGKAWQEITLINKVGRPITLLNQTGTAANQIVSPNQNNLVIEGNIKLIYDAVISKWLALKSTYVNFPLIQTFTTVPTINNFGTVTNAAFNWTIVGDRLVGNGRWTNGTVAAGIASFTLPNGYTANVPGADLYACGRWERAVSTANTVKNGTLMCQTGSSTIFLTLDDYTSANSPAAGVNANVISANSNTMHVWFSIPIAQLAQNTSDGISNQAYLDSYFASAVTANYVTAAGNFADLASYTLKAGRKYVLRSQILFNNNGAITSTRMTAGFSTTSGITFPDINSGTNAQQITPLTADLARNPLNVEYIVTPTVDTTYYAKVLVSGSITNLQFAWSFTVQEIQTVSTVIASESQDREFIAYTSPGVGTALNNRIYRFSTVEKNSLSSYVTYTSDAVNGDTWTILKAGLYSLSFIFESNDANRESGLTINQSNLTTNITANPENQQLVSGVGTASRRGNMSVTRYLPQGSIIRACSDGGTVGTGTGDHRITIARIGI